MCLDVNGMANGNDGPFKDEAKYVVKDVLLDRGKPTERKAPPIEPGPQDGDIIWVYDMMDELGVFPHNAANCSGTTALAASSCPQVSWGSCMLCLHCHQVFLENSRPFRRPGLSAETQTARRDRLVRKSVAVVVSTPF